MDNVQNTTSYLNRLGVIQRESELCNEREREAYVAKHFIEEFGARKQFGEPIFIDKMRMYYKGISEQTKSDIRKKVIHFPIK